jgi:KTSC domain
MTFPTRLIRLPRSARQHAASSAHTITHTFRVDASLPVTSTCIARLEYEPDTEECTYTFYHGGSYTSIIPAIEVERWINSESPGAYYNSHIRGKY